MSCHPTTRTLCKQLVIEVHAELAIQHVHLDGALAALHNQRYPSIVDSSDTKQRTGARMSLRIDPTDPVIHVPD